MKSLALSCAACPGFAEVEVISAALCRARASGRDTEGQDGVLESEGYQLIDGVLVDRDHFDDADDSRLRIDADLA